MVNLSDALISSLLAKCALLMQCMTCFEKVVGTYHIEMNRSLVDSFVNYLNMIAMPIDDFSIDVHSKDRLLCNKATVLHILSTS